MRILFLITASVLFIFMLGLTIKKAKPTPLIQTRPQSTPQFTPTPTPILILPPQKILNNEYHVFQTFNNCGPAALSMALSYYGIHRSQQELGQDLRPFQNQQGDNDDKSVTLAELAEKAKEYQLIPFHRPNGTTELMKQFINQDIPVVTRTLLHDNEDIGHYRVIKGYDDTTGEFIQDDSLQGHNLRYSYEGFNNLWKQFNYEYLVLVPPEKNKIALSILSADADEKTAWGKAVTHAKQELAVNPDDIYARLNLSIAYYNVGDYQSSVSEFEKIEGRLPFRTLWYQIEPIKAYYQLGNYQKVFSLTEKILNNYNRAFSELYFMLGQIYLKENQTAKAQQEFERAIFYNSSYQPAKDALLLIN